METCKKKICFRELYLITLGSVTQGNGVDEIGLGWDFLRGSEGGVLLVVFSSALVEGRPLYAQQDCK